MTRQYDQLRRTERNIEQALKPIETGRADRRRTVRAVDLALEHANQWAGMGDPVEGERGGTSTPESVEERREQERTIRNAAVASERIPYLTQKLDEYGRELFDHVQRLVAVVPPQKVPAPKVPGCQSCARAGHFFPAMPASDEKAGGTIVRGDHAAAEAGLCRWCADHAKDRAVELELPITDDGTWPPVEAVDIMHTQSASAAGRWLARQAAA